jgi:hypothetical protein
MQVFGKEITEEHVVAGAVTTALAIAFVRYTGIGREKLVDAIYNDSDYTVSVIDTATSQELDPQGNIVVV